MVQSWNNKIGISLCLTFSIAQVGMGLGVTAADYLDPLMTNSVDVIVERLSSLPIGEATMARELSTNMSFRADDIAQYIFTNDFSSLANYPAITRRLNLCNHAAKVTRYSCNLHNSETNLLLQAQFHERLDAFLHSEDLLSKAFESPEARWLADRIMRAKLTWRIFGLDTMYGSLHQAITNGCDLSATNSLPLQDRELVSALASSGLFNIRGINVPIASPTGNETNFVSVVATARQGQRKHLFLLDFANYENAMPENKRGIAANALALEAMHEAISLCTKSKDGFSCHTLSFFADTPVVSDSTRSLFTNSFVGGLFRDATNMPSALRGMFFLSPGNSNWIDTDSTFQITDHKSILLESGISDYIMCPSAHEYVNELMAESPNVIVEQLSSFWRHIDRESLVSELSSNAAFRAEEILIAACGKEIPTNSIEAAYDLINQNNIVSLVLSWSCITNISQEAQMAESNYLARISALLDQFDCYGDSGATNPCSDFRRSANDAAFAYSVSRHKDVLDVLSLAIADANTNTNGLELLASEDPIDEITSAIASLKGFSVCATNVPYFNSFTGTMDTVDALICQRGTREKAFYLVNTKFYGKQTFPGKRAVIAEASKLNSLCQGLVERFRGQTDETRTEYIPCLLFDSPVELSPYRTVHGFLDLRCLTLFGSTTEITNQLSRLGVVR